MSRTQIRVLLPQVFLEQEAVWEPDRAASALYPEIIRVGSLWRSGAFATEVAELRDGRIIIGGTFSGTLVPSDWPARAVAFLRQVPT